MEKNVGILIGGIAVAGVVAFLSLNPAGSDQGTNPAPVISTSTPTSAAATPVDQSTSQVATTPKTVKASTPARIGGTATSIGSAGGGDDEEVGERGERGERGEQGEGDDD